MILGEDFDDCEGGFWWLQGRILMIAGKDFGDEHLDLDNSSTSDDGETSADAEANLKMMTNGNAGEWPMVMVNGRADKTRCKKVSPSCLQMQGGG